MRKTKIVTIKDENSRDNGKSYLITEMPASQAEKWGMRALLAMARSGINIPPNIMELGMAGVALVTLNMLMNANWFEVEPLLDEMMTCMQFMYEPDNEAKTRKLQEVDIENMATRVMLRQEWFALHTDFLELAKKWILSAASQVKNSQDTQIPQN